VYSIAEGDARKSRAAFRGRISMRDDGVPVTNTPVDRSFRLIEPLAFPEVVRGERERTILGKYLRDLRRELPRQARFLTDSEGRLTGVQIGDDPPGAPLPFAGTWISQPGRNLVKLGAAFYVETLPDAALAYLRDALELNPNADAANGLGLMFARQGRFTEARDWFQKAITLQRDHSEAINNLGVLYGEQRQFNDAIAAFEYGIRVTPDNDTLYLNLGRIHIQMGDRQKAMSVMERLLARKPHSTIARRALEELR
jgi:tetratricopeptide (TPR) repeat protein